MTNEITVVPTINVRNGRFISSVGSSTSRITQTVPGSTAQSGRAVAAGESIITGLMDGVGLMHVANLSLIDSGDDVLHIWTSGDIPFAIVKLEEQYVIRLDPAASYKVASATATGCDYAITIYED